MQRELAERLMNAVLDVRPSINNLLEAADQIEDEAERLAFRRRIAEATHILAFDLVMHIVRQYPELDPDK